MYIHKTQIILSLAEVSGCDVCHPAHVSYVRYIVEDMMLAECKVFIAKR
jgi:hypothetical protein